MLRHATLLSRRRMLAGACVLGAGLCLASGGAAAQAQTEMLLPVPAITLYPNDEIGEEHIIDRAFIAATVTRGAVLDDRRSVVGRVARRTLLKGQPIPANALRDPYLIISGKTAVVVFQDGGLMITSQAVALQSGSVGDVVSLRNIESGTMIRGVVAGDGTVRVGGN